MQPFSVSVSWLDPKGIVESQKPGNSLRPFFWEGEWRRDPFKWLISDLQIAGWKGHGHWITKRFDFNQAEKKPNVSQQIWPTKTVALRRLWCYSSLLPWEILARRGKKHGRSRWPQWNQWIIDDWVVATQYFECSPRKFGEDEPILTSIFFKGVGKNPPTR